MKPLAFNLKDAKKVAGDKQSSTFMLKDGHQIKVAHAPLPAIQRKQLEKLPVHLDVGGAAVGETPQEAGYAPAPNQVVPQAPIWDRIAQSAQENPYGTLGPGSHYDPQVQAWLPNQPESQTPAQAPAASDNIEAPSDNTQPAPDNTVTPATPAGAATPQMADIPGLVAQGQRGIKEQQGYEEQLAKSNADTESKDVQARQDVLAGFQTNSRQFQDQQGKFLRDYMNNQIQPNHYLENMDAGKKVSTAIGLFLGGWGSAFTHQGNPAMDFLNKQIDRDIQGQQSRIDQQKTLLGANQELYHDNILAMNATRAQENDIYSHQIQLNAAKLGTPAAKARADQASSALGLQTAGLLNQNAIRATVLHAMSKGGAGLDAPSLAAAGFMTPQQAEKEQASINAQKTAKSAAIDLFNKLDREQSTMNLVNPQSYARVDALKAQLVNAVMNASASKRLTRESIEAEVNPLLTRTGNTGQTREAKLDGLLNIIGMHADPTPMMTKYAPEALPKYPFQNAPQGNTPLPVVKEGQTATSNSGKPIVVQGGKWVYKK